jgi:transcriptional regulator with XRE-family HTH domain
VIEKKPTLLLQKIFELRKKKKIGLTELGKVLGGIGGSTASQIENGAIPLKAEYIPAIAKLLGVQAWELFVDYKSNQAGPLTDEEVDLVLSFRQVRSEKKKKKV